MLFGFKNIMNKKTKVITRILCGVLALVLILGLIIPAVSANEITTDPIVEETVTETVAPQEQPTETPTEDPEDDLPDGFHYETDEYGVQHVAKDSDNQFPAIILNDIPDDFDVHAITVFVGNMETYEVKWFTLTYPNNYVASLPLLEGYYVLFTNGYVWETSSGTKYAVNGGQHQYFHVGEDYNSGLYGTNFYTSNDIMSLSLKIDENGQKIIKYGTTLLLSGDNMQYPYDAKLDKLVNDNDNEPSDPDELKPLPQDPTAPQVDDTTKSLNLVWFYFKNMLWKSKFILLILVGCGVLLLVIKQKRKKQQEEQMENDKYDDHRIE